MIRRIIILLLIVSGLHAEADIKSNTKWETSVSYGFLSEKTPVSMLGVSKLLDYDKNSEFYATLGTMLFGSGVGLGYKYYFIDKSNSSIFLQIIFCNSKNHFFAICCFFLIFIFLNQFILSETFSKSYSNRRG